MLVNNRFIKIHKCTRNNLWIRLKKMSKITFKHHLKAQANRIISEIKEQQLLNNINRESIKHPVKITQVEVPFYEKPLEVEVLVTHVKNNCKKSKKMISKQLRTIPYEKSQSNIHTSLIQMKYQQFINYKGNYTLSLAQHQLNPEVVHLPQLVYKYFQDIKNVYAINLWHNKGFRISEWHYDGHDNILYVIQGTKKLQLKSPSDHNINLKSIFSIHYNHAHRNYKDKLFYTQTTIRAGQCLIIPKGWLHRVISSGSTNIGLNIWGNSINFKKEEQNITLRYLIHQISQSLCQQLYQQWETINEKKKQKLRRHHFKQHQFKYLN